ncbi:hypothetical protein [Proteiniphilum saccharofermentans]|nr:hypothetical protein [Proteiniphilum saccharofermentans]
MKLYYARRVNKEEKEPGAIEVVEIDLEKLFSDSKSGNLKPASAYERVCGITTPEMGAGGDMALDGGEEWVWFRVGKEEALKYLPEGTGIAEPFGPRNMGPGPGGMDSKCRRYRFAPSLPGSEHEWVTHEAVISPDEVAFAIMGHRPIPYTNDPDRPEGTAVGGANPGQEAAWGPSGIREKPTGLGIVNIRTREMHIAGQIPYGSGFWHVHGSPDKRFAVGDNFDRELYLINRETDEMILLTAGHKTTAADHVHPTFSPDGTKIHIQSAMLSEDNRSMNICIVPVPEKWLKKEE